MSRAKHSIIRRTIGIDYVLFPALAIFLGLTGLRPVAAPALGGLLRNRGANE